MHLTTHILTGWCLAELNPTLTRREKATIVVGAVVSDLDGLGVLAEIATRNTDHPLLWWTDYHHILGHNLFFAVLYAIIAARIASARAGAWSFVAVHLHILADVAGSRGPDDYPWPIPYLHPFRNEPQLAWEGQWYLNAWPNFVITAVLVALTIVLAWRRGYSIVDLVSRRADEAFIDALRQRFGRPERWNCWS